MFGLIKETVDEWRDDNISRMAAALSYFAAISIAPLLVLALTVASMFYSTEQARSQFSQQIQSVMGEQSSEILVSVLENADQPQVASIAGIISFLVLLWGASNVFNQLQNSMNDVWDVELKPSVGFWGTVRDRLLSFGMVLAMAFLLIVSLVLSTVLSVVNAQFSSLLPGAGWLWQFINQLVTFIAIAFIFGLIYKVLPDVEITWNDVTWGAIFTALLFTIGQFLLGLYLGRQSAGSAYGAAGSLMVFLIWVYFSAQIFLFGAEFTLVYARRRGSGVVPAENAQYADAPS